MREIPEILKGKEVWKFEDEIDRSCYEPIYCMISEDEYDVDGEFSEERLFDLKDFYTQPFTTDMLNYFEGWEEGVMVGMKFINEDKVIYCQEWGFNQSQGYSIRVITNKSSNLQLIFEMVCSLSDFIDSCLNSDIKLRWKS